MSRNRPVLLEVSQGGQFMELLNRLENDDILAVDYAASIRQLIQRESGEYDSGLIDTRIDGIVYSTNGRVAVTKTVEGDKIFVPEGVLPHLMERVKNSSGGPFEARVAINWRRARYPDTKYVLVRI